jgi:transposase
VRATTLLNAVLDLAGVTVVGVSLPTGDPFLIMVEITLRRRRLICPYCRYSTKARWDTRPVHSRWRHLDAFRRRVEVHTVRRRLRCPEHGVVTEGVPFARPRSEFTRDFEDVIAFWATKTDKTTISRALRLDWDTVGRICQRVVDDGALDVDRLDGLVRIGVDEVSWKKQFHFLTLVTDHDRRRIVWGTTGRDSGALNRFFAELGPDRAAQLQAVSLDMGPPFIRSVYDNAPQAVMCTDPFHAVQRVTKALDAERRRAAADLKDSGDATAVRKFRGARWALLKNPDKLNDNQARLLRRIKRRGGDLWRAYTLKEAFRAIFAGDLTPTQVTELIDRWISRASRSRLPAFVSAARTIKTFRLGLIAAIDLGINNARSEGLNNVVRLIIRRARGFHSPQAALALVMLCCGPITLHLPHERGKIGPA